MLKLSARVLLCAALLLAIGCSDEGDEGPDDVSDGGEAGARGDEDGGEVEDGGAVADPLDGEDAGEPNGEAGVRYVGRVDLSDTRGGRFSWSGTGVVARFMGSSVAVSLSGGQEYTAVLDGMVRPKLVPGSGSTTIASGLSAGVHTIELYRRTEANQGVSQFLGFDLGAGGMLLTPPLAPARRIEIIGDSITVGYGNEGADQSCRFTPQTENHYLTYGPLAARALRAELSTIAWSGLGMVCNYGDEANSCTNPLPTYYERTLPTMANSRWDFAGFTPDAVVINLGTNDFSTNSDPSQAEFTSAYRAFLMRVREKYPRARILCTIGPLLSGAELTRVRMYIANAVADTGDDNMTTFELQPQVAADGLGCDYHPNLKTHQKMADVLIEALKEELGW